ncbi:MAG: hypothetical protein K2L23_02695, partial [Odoribacter sp.]|nr:hypothetical protein [Odoribacter sp.]
MVKKIVTIFFLALASMIILAFTVMPHHHHEEYICFNRIHCEQDAPDGHHHHDTDPLDPGHGCVKNLFQAPVSRVQSLGHNGSDFHSHHFSVILFLVPDLSALFAFATNEQILYRTVFRERLYASGYI